MEAFSKQEASLQFSRLTYSPLHHTSSSSLSLQTSLASPPPSLLSIHFSSLLSPLHLPRDLARGRMSYVVYESSIYLVGSARTGSPYISVTVGWNTARLPWQPQCPLYIIIYTAKVHTFISHNGISMK